MIDNVKGQDGAKGDRDAKIAAIAGNVAGSALRKGLKATGIGYMMQMGKPAVKAIVGVSDVANEVHKLKTKEKEDLANGLEVETGTKTKLFFSLAAKKVRSGAKDAKKVRTTRIHQPLVPASCLS